MINNPTIVKVEANALNKMYNISIEHRYYNVAKMRIAKAQMAKSLREVYGVTRMQFRTHSNASRDEDPRSYYLIFETTEHLLMFTMSVDIPHKVVAFIPESSKV